MKISCILNLNLEEMKDLFYKELNDKWKKINKSELVSDALLGELLLDGLEPIFMDIYEIYGEEMAMIIYDMDNCIQMAKIRIKRYSDDSPLEGKEYIIKEVNEYMIKAILLYFSLPENKDLENFLEKTINEFLSVDKKGFKCLRAMLENSVFKTNWVTISKIGLGIAGVEVAYIEEHPLSRQLIALAELSAEGYSSEVKDYIDLVESGSIHERLNKYSDLLDSDASYEEKVNKFESLEALTKYLYELCKSIDKALDLADISDLSKSCLRKAIAHKVLEDIMYFDVNVEDKNLKVVSKEDEEKYLKYLI